MDTFPNNKKKKWIFNIRMFTFAQNWHNQINLVTNIYYTLYTHTHTFYACDGIPCDQSDDWWMESSRAKSSASMFHILFVPFIFSIWPFNLVKIWMKHVLSVGDWECFIDRKLNRRHEKETSIDAEKHAEEKWAKYVSNAEKSNEERASTNRKTTGQRKKSDYKFQWMSEYIENAIHGCGCCCCCYWFRYLCNVAFDMHTWYPICGCRVVIRYIYIHQNIAFELWSRNRECIYNLHNGMYLIAKWKSVHLLHASNTPNKSTNTSCEIIESEWIFQSKILFPSAWLKTRNKVKISLHSFYFPYHFHIHFTHPSVVWESFDRLFSHMPSIKIW